MADVDDILARLEQALEIYGRIVELMNSDETNRALLEDPAKKMRWAIKELATQFWRSEKQ
jgi:hypothetical protein